MTEGESESSESDEVIFWSETVEDRTLADIEQILEEEKDIDFSDVDGTKGVSKTVGEHFITDFDTEFPYEDGTLRVTVERDGGLNTLEYWSEDPEVMSSFRDLVSKRKRDNEHQPILEPYRFDDVKSDEIATLIKVYENEYELEGPLPRGSNGQPRMHMVRVEHSDSKSDFRDDNEIRKVDQFDKIPGDVKYEIKGLNPDSTDEGMIDVEGHVNIKPQKHDRGLYTVEIVGEDIESQAYMVNTSLRAINPEEEEDYNLLSG